MKKDPNLLVGEVVNEPKKTGCKLWGMGERSDRPPPWEIDKEGLGGPNASKSHVMWIELEVPHSLKKTKTKTKKQTVRKKCEVEGDEMFCNQKKRKCHLKNPIKSTLRDTPRGGAGTNIGQKKKNLNSGKVCG